MVVCVCKGVSDRQILHAVQSGVDSLGELRTATGVSGCCGKCSDCARGVIEQSKKQCSRRDYQP